MRVFVTGASGWIGSALTPELIANGHHVLGLARSASSATALTSAGAEVIRGSLDDLDTLHAAASAADGVIHLAFKHDLAFTGDFRSAVDADRRVVDTIGRALAGSGKPFVVTGGTPAVAGRVASEEDGLGTDSDAAAEENTPSDRAAVDRLAVGLARQGVRSSVVRLPRTNHGEGDSGFIANLIAVARRTGVSGHVGDGSSRWPATHRLDTARAFRLALEKAPAGSVLHAVAEEGIATRDIAEAIGRHLGLPVTSREPEHFGFLGMILAVDQPASGIRTREILGWEPTHATLLDDIDAGHYFRQPTAQEL
ncbi:MULTISPECIES: SDR family oxidoreductase [unclassified Streptomyces]|uniref:SDR family oxidoreductase n=1 Tax=unclassified Streptomyces TaxID=2593676 RepID=UPI00378D6695